MGELEGIRGAWGYPEGGMGAVSDSMAKAAQEAGAEIVIESPVEKVNC
jgi:phytoene dehydrogenase-like protein